NTGAMARGYRTTPYPSIEILKMIYLGGGKIMINSDCHKKEFLDFGFDVAVDLAKKVGFDQTYIFTKDGFVAQKI
ncbi:MAG: histidinol phosphate phosphatase, partial [Clostridia bacterium]|nr:histidinol phosphate phosphatase [Clostridia bacterium]